MAEEFSDVISDGMELAKLEKDAGRLNRAIAHAAEAAEPETSPGKGLWDKLYRAWYVQVRNSNQAGIDAIRQEQQQIANSGVANPKLAEKARLHPVDFQNQHAAAGR